MREILFRGKRVDNGEWVEGYFIQKGSQTFIASYPYFTGKVHETSWLEFCFGGFIEVIPETVGQYTGLTDKNGKKIFEGDCFKTYYTGLPAYKNIVGYYPEHFAFMARCIEMNTVHYLSDYRTSAIEVIGNIHDNPKLLEVEE